MHRRSIPTDPRVLSLAIAASESLATAGIGEALMASCEDPDDAAAFAAVVAASRARADLDRAILRRAIDLAPVVATTTIEDPAPARRRMPRHARDCADAAAAGAARLSYDDRRAPIGVEAHRAIARAHLDDVSVDARLRLSAQSFRRSGRARGFDVLCEAALLGLPQAATIGADVAAADNALRRKGLRH